jgi:hypothetical protein
VAPLAAAAASIGGGGGAQSPKAERLEAHWVDPLLAEEKLRWVRGGDALGDGRRRWVDDKLRQPAVVVAHSSSVREVMASCAATWEPHCSYVVAALAVSYCDVDVF